MLNSLRLLFCVACLLSCNDSIVTLKELKGLDQKEVTSIYGTPDSEASYKMSEEIVLFEINRNLLSYFPEDSSIMIHDMTWNKIGYKVKVWLHQKDGSWKVIDAIKYQNSVKF